MIKHTIKCPPFGRTTREVNLTRGKAIRYFCVECCGWQSREVRECPDAHCPLYPYRLGRLDPNFGTDNENAVRDDFSINSGEDTC